MTTSRPNLIAALVAGCTYQLAEHGAMLFEEGQPCRGLHLLASATVRLSKCSAGGDLEIQPDLGAGMVLGISEMLSKRPYGVTALVVERGEIGFIPLEALTALVARKMDALSLAVRTNLEARVQLTGLLSRTISAVFEAEEERLKNTMASD